MSADRPKLRVLDLFSGIGGFSLGLERTGGFETVAFCEIEPFPRKVLKKHWPEVPQYEDVTKLTGDILGRDGIAVDVITGGFPCQDLSAAGKQAGMGEGTRSGLWSEIVRLISELSPRYVIVENVAALLSGPSERRGGWFGRVLGDLAGIGYDAEWENIPAAAVGAPHRRERIWIVAYSNSRDGKSGPSKRPGIWNKVSGQGSDNDVSCSGDASKIVADTAQLQRNVSREHNQQASRQISEFRERGCSTDVAPANKGRSSDGAWLPQPGVGRMVDGVSARLDGDFRWPDEPNVGRVATGVNDRASRLKGLGNAVVPQIPELIGRAILKAEEAEADFPGS